MIKVSEFVKAEHFVEAVHAMPASQPAQTVAFVQSLGKNAPQYWYDTLKLWELEAEHSLPRGILLHLIDIESKGNPFASSGKGAKSLFGIMPSGKSGFKGDINDPVETAQFAAKTLRYLINHFHGIEQGLAAYNWGMGNLAKKGIKQAPEQTRKYLKFFKERGIIPQNRVYAPDSWGEEDILGPEIW